MSITLNPRATGGVTTWAMMPGVRGDALFAGEQLEHRLWLERRWDDLLGKTDDYALWLGMNPSRARSDVDDLTIRKEQVFTGNVLKLQRMYKVNVGTYCCTNPAELPGDVPLMHHENFRTIMDLATKARVVVIATGMPPRVLRKDADGIFSAMLSFWGIKPICLGYAETGWPRHPSRLSYSTPFQPFTWPRPLTSMGKI